MYGYRHPAGQLGPNNFLRWKDLTRMLKKLFLTVALLLAFTVGSAQSNDKIVVSTAEKGTFQKYDLPIENWFSLHPTPVDQGDMIAGDFNQDGYSNLVMSFDDGIWFWSPNQLGTFQPTPAYLHWHWMDPYQAYQLAAGDVDGDGFIDMIGTWFNGTWMYSFKKDAWIQLTTYENTGDIAAGDFDGDGRADVASVWPDGLWVQNGATLKWTKIDGVGADQLAAGDITGDGTDELIATYPEYGIWYYDFVTDTWTEMIDLYTPGPITSGDYDGDGKDDVASIWSDGLWFQSGADLTWTWLSTNMPYTIINITTERE